MKTTQPKKASKKKPADLRTCASCEWVYRLSEPIPKKKLDAGITQGACPQCGFGSYGARYVYGAKAYRYAITQKKWFEKKMTNFACTLHPIIDTSPAAIKSRQPIVHKLILPKSREC